MSSFEYDEHASPHPDERATRPHQPVTIVGGGPVGLATAALLAQRGVGSVVLNASRTVGFGSRAICISRRSLEILATLGLDGPILDIALPWTGGRSFFRDTEVLTFTMPHSDTQRFPPMVNVQQYLLEQALIDNVTGNPLVDLRWGSEVEGVESTTDGARLRVRSDRDAYVMSSPWVVAADGGRSPMRRLLGLELSGSSYEGRYVIADIVLESDRPTERLAWFDPPTFPGKTVLMHRQPHDLWRIDYQIDPDEDEAAAVDPVNVLPRIAAHLEWMGEKGEWTPEWISTYRAHSLSLDSYRHDRVLFAGDAAHLVPIFGVRGLNGGLVDANNLAWRLADVVHRRAADSTLDTYAIEQRHAWSENIRNAEQSTVFMTPGTPGRTLARDAALELAADDPVFATLLNPRQTSAIDYSTSPANVADTEAWAEGVAPGGLVPDVVVGRVGRDGTVEAAHLSAVLGDRYLAVVGAGVIDDPLPALEADVVRLTALEDADVGMIVDLHGELADALGVVSTSVHVIRPDRHLLARRRAWSAADRAAVETAVATGIAPVAATAPAPLEASPAEQAWTRLAALLDRQSRDRVPAVMTKLALLLATDLDDTERLDAFVEQAERF